MKKLYQNYSNSLKAITDGKYTNCELFPGFAGEVAAAILQVTEHRANTTSVCLPYDDDCLLEDILISIIKRIDNDPIIGNDWIKLNLDQETVKSIYNKWNKQFTTEWTNWGNKVSLSQKSELANKFKSIAKSLTDLIIWLIYINPINLGDIFKRLLPPKQIETGVENPPVIVDVPEQSESVQTQEQEQVASEVGVENPPVIASEQSESVQEQTQEQEQVTSEVATEEPVATTNSLGIPNENSNLQVPIEPVSLVDPSLSMTLGGEGESLEPIPEMRFRDMSSEASAFYTIRGRKHFSNKNQAPIVFLLESSMDKLKELGIAHCIVSNIKMDTTSQLIELVVSDQSKHKKFYVYFDTVGRHVDICTSKK